MSKKVYVIIGAGASGLVIAKGLVRAKKQVIIIEKGAFGGDCTNFGCIPSKTLIASSKVANSISNAKNFGLEGIKPSFSADLALEQVRQMVQRFKATEDVDALKELGIQTIKGHARFLDPHTLDVEKEDGIKEQIKADKIIIACGSSPIIPDIEGLDKDNFLTNETVFDLKTVPKELVILGGGPIGCELAQAYQRLGSIVTILHKHERLFDKGSSRVSPIILETFKKEGIKVIFNANLKKIEKGFRKQQLIYEDNITMQERTLNCDKLLIAIGRRPNVVDLDLEKAGIQYSEKGIYVDEYGRTNMPHVLACGDVTGRPFFTHLAENRARGILVNLLLPFGLKKKLQILQPIPRVTYTDPEVASIGLHPDRAKEVFGEKKIASYYVPMSEVDRAICERREEGFIEITTRRWSSQIIGATIVAPRAGEMLMQISTAMQSKIPLRKFTNLIHPYPVFNLGIRKAADMWLMTTIFGRKL